MKGDVNIIKKLTYICFVLLYRLVLDLSYIIVVAPLYGYAGFTSKQTLSLLILSWLVCLGFSVISYNWYQNKNLISCEVLYIVFILSFVPFTTMMRFGNFTISFVVAYILFFACLALFQILVGLIISGCHFRVMHHWTINDPILYLTLIISFLLITYISWRYTGFRLNFNLLKVYDLRAEAKTFHFPTIINYLFSWTRAINTVLIAYFAIRKKYIFSFTAFILQMLSFGIDGSKTVFFFALCALLISIFPKLELERLNRCVLIGVTVLLITGLIIYTVSGNFVVTSMFARRTMFLPIQLSQNYFDFFTTHVPDYYRGSFLKYFGFSTPYKNLPYLIGETYYNSPQMGANNGLLSDAITNWGYIGILINPLFLVLVLKMFDIASYKLDSRIYITVALYLSIVMTNSFLLVVLLSHGGFVLMILLAFMKRNGSSYRLNQRKFI